MTDIFPPGPLSKEVILAALKKDNYIEASVEIDLTDYITDDDNNYEQFLDALSEGSIGTYCLMDIDFEAVAISPRYKNCVIFNVRGDASEFNDGEEND
jgi:hypothetical protein